MTTDEYEDLRCEYKPDRIRVLFVGESRPANGTFFYMGNSMLFKHTMRCFGEHCNRPWRDPADFLTFVKSKDCYLDDLCREPVNHLDRKTRRWRRAKAVCDLAGRIRQYRPQAVVCVMRGIEPYVRDALAQAELEDVPFYSLPFPARGYQEAYCRELWEALVDLIRRGILDCDC